MPKHVVLLKSRASNCGGLEKYASRIAAAFAAKGDQVTILTTGSSPHPIHTPSISIHPFKTSRWPSFLRMEQFDRCTRNWLRSQKVDLILGMDRNRIQTHIRAGNGVHAAYLKSRVLTEGRLKHWICLMNPMHRKILQLEKEAFENPSLQKLFANSHMVRQQILEYYSIDPAKIEVIHNGVEWREMEKDFSEWEQGRLAIAERFHLDPRQFHFLFIGNGYLRKGLDRLLAALAQLKSSDFHLSVIGKDNNMELYCARAVQLGLKNKVRFFGPQQEIRPFYQLADVLVIPSFYDPFANVTVEALAMGLFVVSSKNNGGCEILDQQNGIVIEDLLDPASIIQALNTSLLHRKTQASAWAARQSIAHLDFSKQLQKLIEACG